MNSQMPAEETSQVAGRGIVACAFYDIDGRRHDIALEHTRQVLNQHSEGFIWIGLHEPNETELGTLQEQFDLHDLAIEDARTAHQRSKVEAYGSSLFIVVRTSEIREEHIHYGETHLFLGPRYLITIRHSAARAYARIRTRVERDPDMLHLGPAFATYAVLDAIVDDYLPVVSDFQNTLQTLEKEIFSATYRKDIVKRLYDLKRELTTMQTAVGPLQDVLSQMLHVQQSLIPDEVRLYLRDVHDHAVRASEAINTLRDLLGTALSVNLSLVTAAQGETMKRLGAWAALLAVPTLITSWYGMNFKNMPELDDRYAYPAMIGLILVVCIVLYRAFKRAHWL